MTQIATLDATGLLCPLPVLKARKRLRDLAVGEILRVRADDPAALVDFPHFCSESGHEMLDIIEENNEARIYVIRKNG